ncbi:gamma-glutamylcyclotransferase [Aspergillus mulundensis]|uniref:glutathione-specific gamma-glutamylcyclotransferase n=1 Tax=Aspergillus mulundensis TaxID=1810919 RepID=A0A3D8SKK6_9EURO|nr:Gamma-glutamylcyclotransferase [Aspergillus mulundensis]RDW86711.1 Gamma-glutamylcyclotransferase [Aspergillus mulundensis]
MAERGGSISQREICTELTSLKEFDLEATAPLCTDHRGTPERPGRVVTVIERNFWETLGDPLSHLESATTRVWGAAYHIPASHAEEVHDYLDVREIDGYSVHYTPFHPVTTSAAGTATSTDQPPSTTPITCMVYIGQPSNPQFLRDPARREPQDVADVISRGVGQSGKNTEYLYLLEKALEGIGLGSADEHVTDLVRRVRSIEGLGEAGKEEAKAERDVKAALAVAEASVKEGERGLAE